jgi:hypothetical protein
MIFQFDTNKIGIEIVALGINLANNKKIAEMMCQDNGLKLLMKRCFKTKNALLFKMVKNIAKHDGPTKLLLLV